MFALFVVTVNLEKGTFKISVLHALTSVSYVPPYLKSISTGAELGSNVIIIF